MNKELQDLGNHNLNQLPKYHIGDKINWLGKERVISAIYLDNPTMYEFEGCVGMLTEDQIDSCGSCETELKQRPEQTVQVKTAGQFKVGDDVWCGSLKCSIYNIKGNTAYVVFNGGADWVSIHRLSPYVEPQYKFNIGDKVWFRNRKIKVVKKRYPSPYDEFAHYLVETLNGQSPINVVESELESYTEEIKK